MLVTASLESRSTGHTVVLQAFTIVSLRVACRPVQQGALEKAFRGHLQSSLGLNPVQVVFD